MQKVGQFVAEMMGKNYNTMVDNAAALKEQADAYEANADNSGDAAKNMAKVTKEAQKQLAVFDDLSILSSGNSLSEALDKETSGGSGFNTLKKEDFSWIDDRIAKLMQVIGGALIAVGIILTFMGNFAWGIGFIIAGAFIYGVGEKSYSKSDPTKTPKEKIAELGTIVGAAMIVVGIILIFFGKIGWGIGAIIAGLITEKIAQETLNESGTSSIVTEWVNKNKDIIKPVSIGMALLGIILIATGQINPLSIGMLAGGGALLGVTLIAEDKEATGNSISKWATEHSGLIKGIGIACGLLGVLLIVFGQINKVSMGLLWAGAGLFGVGVLSEDPDAFKDGVGAWAKTHKNELLDMFAALSLVGILLMVWGQYKLGAGFLVAGAGGIVGTSLATGEDLGTMIDEWGKKNWGIIAGMGTALMVAGMVLMMKGDFKHGAALLAMGMGVTEGSLEKGVRELTAGQPTGLSETNKNTLSTGQHGKKIWANTALTGGKNVIVDSYEASIRPTTGFTVAASYNEYAADKQGNVYRLKNGAGTWWWDKHPTENDYELVYSVEEEKRKQIEAARGKAGLRGLSAYATGGIVPRATTALIGEDGAEAVLPLEKNTEWMDMLADRIGGGKEQTVILQIDGREFGRAVLKHGNSAQRIVGTRLVTVK